MTFGFYKEHNPILLTKNGITKPRIMIGFYDGNNYYKYGYKTSRVKNKLVMGVHFYKIDYPIIKCNIDRKWVADQDICFIKSTRKN